MQQGQQLQPIVVDRRSRECDRSRQLITTIKTRSKIVLASSIITSSSSTPSRKTATLSGSSSKMRAVNCINSNRHRHSNSSHMGAAISKRRDTLVTKPSYCNSNRECSNNLIDISSKRTSRLFHRLATLGRQRVSEP